MVELLEYIKSEIPGVDTIDHALELSKLGSENPDSEDLGIPKGGFQRLVASTTMKTFDKWHMDIEALSGIDDKLVLLTRFSEIEVQIEPIERQIEELVADIDERVNLQVDEMRMQELLKEGRVIRPR